MMCLSLTSCVTSAYAQVDDIYDNVDFSVVVTYGVPYYNAEGLILYYLYRDMYYYPYYYNNRFYFHRYRHPLPPERLHRYHPMPRGSHGHGHVAPPPGKPKHHDVSPGRHRDKPRSGGVDTRRPSFGNGQPRTSSPRTTSPSVGRQNSSRPSTPSVSRSTPSRPSTSSVSRSSTPSRSSAPARSSGGGGHFGGRR